MSNPDPEDKIPTASAANSVPVGDIEAQIARALAQERKRAKQEQLEKENVDMKEENRMLRLSQAVGGGGGGSGKIVNVNAGGGSSSTAAASSSSAAAASSSSSGDDEFVCCLPCGWIICIVVVILILGGGGIGIGI